MSDVVKVKTNILIPFIETLLEEKKMACITVTGMSMYPFLRETIDRVELSRADFGSMKVGDIVLARRLNGEYVLHRVWGKTSDSFYMVGDAQTWIDGPYSKEQLVAASNAIWRGNRRIDCSKLWWRIL
ncbi:MAG TPA: S24/S26 family peptidase, partial [Clostridia bacterium]